jgi:hypothetical protein
MNPSTVLTRIGLFAVSTALGLLLIFAVTEVLRPAVPQSSGRVVADVVSTPAPDASPGGGPDAAGRPVFAVFDLVPASPQPLQPLEPAVFDRVAQQAAPVEPNANGIPRVQPVSQFDGSPFQGANCNLAAGAMLAQLGWGIVTRGGILRTLQDDQVGGTDLGDLNTALWRGYGVSPSWGAITPVQLRRLVAAGYGAVVHGLYGVLRPPFNIQPSFKGPHAIYVDAFFPGSASTPAAYYVIDPLHKPHSGYRGAWIPASIVEAFAAALAPNGRVVAAWAFPIGGAPPVITDIGPLPAGGGISPNPGEPPLDPADPPVTLPEEPGDATVTIAPSPPTIDPVVTVGDTRVPTLGVCVILPRPSACPNGITGRYGRRIQGRPGSQFPTIDVRFVMAPIPNEVLVGFATATPGPVDVVYWPADGSGCALRAGSSSTVSLPGGQTVRVARLSTIATTRYRFQVVAAGLGGAKSPVGDFTTGAGLKNLGLDLGPIDRPVIGLDPDSIVYSRVKSGSLAPPALRCDSSGTGVRIEMGGQPYCLPDERAPAPSTCVGLKVAYELAGVTADQVAVRAIPRVTSRHVDGSPAEETTIEALGPPGAGGVTLGCLTPGMAYDIAIDIPGDPLGPLTTRSITVPAS